MSDEFLGTIIRKGKWGRRINNALNVGAMAAAPFTGGMSLGANAARIAAQKGLLNMARKRQLGKLGGAKEGLEGAKVGVEAATKNLNRVELPSAKPYRGRRSPGAPGTPSAERAEAALTSERTTLDNWGVAKPKSTPTSPVTPVDAVEETSQGMANLQESASNASASQNNYGLSGFVDLGEAQATQRNAQGIHDAAKAKVDSITQQKKYLDEHWKDIQNSKLGENANIAGMVGVQSFQSHQRNKQIDAQRQAEDEKRARENAGTGGAKSTTTGF